MTDLSPINRRQLRRDRLADFVASAGPYLLAALIVGAAAVTLPPLILKPIFELREFAK